MKVRRRNGMKLVSWEENESSSLDQSKGKKGFQSRAGERALGGKKERRKLFIGSREGMHKGRRPPERPDIFMKKKGGQIKIVEDSFLNPFHR